MQVGPKIVHTIVDLGSYVAGLMPFIYDDQSKHIFHPMKPNLGVYHLHFIIPGRINPAFLDLWFRSIRQRIDGSLGERIVGGDYYPRVGSIFLSKSGFQSTRGTVQVWLNRRVSSFWMQSCGEPCGDLSFGQLCASKLFYIRIHNPTFKLWELCVDFLYPIIDYARWTKNECWFILAGWPQLIHRHPSDDK